MEKIEKVTYEELVEACFEAIRRQKDKGDDMVGGALFATSDLLAQFLMRPFLDAALRSEKDHIPIPYFLIFIGAFQLAEKACMDFFKTKAPEEFADLVNECGKEVIKASEANGFLSRWYEANRKSEEDKHEELS